MSWDELYYELAKLLGELLEEVLKFITACLIGCGIATVIGLILVAWLAAAHPAVLVGIVLVAFGLFVAGAIAAEEGKKARNGGTVPYYQIEPIEADASAQGPLLELAPVEEPARLSKESIPAAIERLKAEAQQAIEQLTAEVYRDRYNRDFDEAAASERMRAGTEQIRRDLMNKIADVVEGSP